jgi:ubiquinone/menaquinone biosynthesis C-methylase UbiE
MQTDCQETPKVPSWDHSSDPNFLDYYEQQSLSHETVQRFSLVRDKALGLLAAECGGTLPALHVADIGCGSGTQCRLWAELGHRVHGLDVNAPLIELAKRRAREDSLEIVFDVGSATDLPYPDSSMDVALLPQLLEHVADWEKCLNEAVRILKPGGLLYISTTNWLCPIQEEFNLPIYSWYPGFLKRKYERLAITTRPEIANHCKYPAVNWFSFYSLANYLKKRGFRCMDRFDMVETEGKGGMRKIALTLIRSIPPLRFLGHVMTSASVVFAIKIR